MANLTTIEKEILEKLFEMKGGYVLDFTDRTFSEFFEDELGINIFDDKYSYHTGSKANRMRAFWRKEKNELVAKSILKLIEYIQLKLSVGDFKPNDYSEVLLSKAKQIAERLTAESFPNDLELGKTTAETGFIEGIITIRLNDKIFHHVKKLLRDGHHFNAVEESFKIVREKLKEITGSEKATEAFRRENLEKIFGCLPRDEAEKDFFEGVKFLHMAIQFFRNEKAHTPAYKIDKNLAIHYIVIASLAYELISRSMSSE